MSQAFLEDLEWRGLLHQCSDIAALGHAMSQKPITLYCGFDPTAVSLHVGNLVPLLSIVRFARAGHRALALVGGATGLIGDPSGKSNERVLQSSEDVLARSELIKKQLMQYVGPVGGTVVNNLDWTREVRLLEFLRDIGKNFSVNAMIRRDSVSARLDREGEGISYTEFSYMLLQAFDYLNLFERHGCTLQIGGSDQWGNIVSGADLIRRTHNASAFALTFPLLTNSDGEKFGKSVQGAVWLDPALTSPWDFYQFWVNAADADVIRFLKVFTFLSRAEIEVLDESVRERPHLREAQKRLASEMTILVHGEAQARQIVAAVEAIFGGGDVTLMSSSILESLLSSVPSVILEKGEVPKLNSMLVRAGIEASMGKANESVRQGAISVNNVRQGDAHAEIPDANWLHGAFLVLKKGKKHFALVKRVP
ncbi:MAG: tyrosine--tRNA ligase [Burkholderiaceae bacterium]|jgi:tyrosyl-tRNA synthetase